MNDPTPSANPKRFLIGQFDMAAGAYLRTLGEDDEFFRLCDRRDELEAEIPYRIFGQELLIGERKPDGHVAWFRVEQVANGGEG